MNTIASFDNQINSLFNKYVQSPSLIRGLLHLVLVLYAARLAPNLPKEVYVLFENQYFKLFIFSVIIWTVQVSPITSVLIALGFLVSLNYANNLPLWEFLDNVENQTDAPVAPNKEVAIDSAIGVLESQETSAPIVSSVTQNNDTIVIQPSIVTEADGSQSVVTPSVVVAPAIIETPSGDKMIIKPDVTTIQPNSEIKASEVLPSKVENVFSKKEEVPVQQQEESSGCYPVKRYDLSKVSPFTYESSGFGVFKI